MFLVFNKKLVILSALTILFMMMFLFMGIRTGAFDYAMTIRLPKILSMFVAAFCIGVATIIFQTLIRSTVVTPCLLGMNSLYVFTHTVLVFVLGTSNQFISNSNFMFALDLSIMVTLAIVVYGFLFKKSNENILVILLAGTVIATLLTSMTSTIQRIMDPNEFATLQNSLVASFNKVNSNILVVSMVLILCTLFVLRKELKVLDVLPLGKAQAINLGIDYAKVSSRLLIGVSVLIAIATALVGPISFLGLIIGNLARKMMKTYKHKILLFSVVLVGCIVLFAGQMMIERVFHFNANMSAFVNIVGGIYFLILILQERGKV